MKLRKFWAVGEGHEPGAPPKSATAMFYYKKKYLVIREPDFNVDTDQAALTVLDVIHGF